MDTKFTNPPKRANKGEFNGGKRDSFKKNYGQKTNFGKKGTSFQKKDDYSSGSFDGYIKDKDEDYSQPKYQPKKKKVSKQETFEMDLNEALGIGYEKEKVRTKYEKEKSHKKKDKWDDEYWDGWN